MTIFNKIDSLFFNIAKASIFLCMFLITFNAAGRYIFHKPITGAYEFTELYLMVTMVFLSLSYTWQMRGFIAINIFSNKFSMPLKNIVYILILFSGISFFGLIGYEASIGTFDAYMNDQRASGIIQWPISLSTIWIPIGCLMIVLRMIIEFIIGLKKLSIDGIKADLFNQIEKDNDLDIENN